MTPEQEQELRERRAAISPAPWRWEPTERSIDITGNVYRLHFQRPASPIDLGNGGSVLVADRVSVSDAEFIARAAVDLDLVLAELDLTRAKMERLERIAREWLRAKREALEVWQHEGEAYDSEAPVWQELIKRTQFAYMRAQDQLETALAATEPEGERG